MIRKQCVIVALCLIFMIPFNTGCGGSVRDLSPEDVVMSFLDAIQRKDVKAIRELSLDPKWVNSVMDIDMFEASKDRLSVKYSNIRIEPVVKTDTQARFRLSFDYSIEFFGVKDSGSAAGTVELIKWDRNATPVFKRSIDGKWLIQTSQTSTPRSSTAFIFPYR